MVPIPIKLNSDLALTLKPMSGSKVSVCIPIRLKSAVDVCPNTDVSIPTVPPMLTLLKLKYLWQH
ncbi:MAG: hypothetical protein CM15mP113_2440 [Pseudomonadota bacterium]|nr:MAG: hypothetical protein CM15mP113_2440 [Pseudomonadota bacterium]